MQLLGRATARWQLVKADDADVLHFYRKQLDNALPRCLQARATSMSLSALPYVYPTIKLKCLPTILDVNSVCSCVSPFDGTHADIVTCFKNNHACFRNIVSFCKLPSRLSYRYVGRSLQFLIGKHLRGWQLQGMRSLNQRTCSDFWVLVATTKQADVPRRCRCCDRVMSHVGAYAADAGQAFEAMPLSLIEN